MLHARWLSASSTVAVCEMCNFDGSPVPAHLLPRTEAWRSRRPADDCAYRPIVHSSASSRRAGVPSSLFSVVYRLSLPRPCSRREYALPVGFIRHLTPKRSPYGCRLCSLSSGRPGWGVRCQEVAEGSVIDRCVLITPSPTSPRGTRARVSFELRTVPPSLYRPCIR